VSDQAALQKNGPDVCVAGGVSPMVALGLLAGVHAGTAADFAHPPLSYHPTALYWLNDTISNAVIDEQLTAFRDKDGYGAIAILPMEEYWEPWFIDRYGHLLEKLDSLGMWAIFCDDKSFPSGTAGGLIAKSYPELCSRRLYKSEKDVDGPSVYREAVPDGTLMGCVAMDNRDRSRRVNVTPNVHNDTLTWDVPEGNWKVMAFVTRRSADFIDYLNPAAVDKWISLTYQRFYDRFPKHFGTTIKSSFYDDIALYQANRGPNSWEGEEHTCWTDGMNALFIKKYGRDPTTLYPALWYEVGPETSAARTMFFGLRAELLSDAFVGRVARWCAKHSIDASGHPAGDYSRSPMAGPGDAIKFYKHAQRPLVDVIFGYGQGRDGFKLSSSAAFLYDRPLLQCETYGAFNQQDQSKFTPDILYRTAMELFTRGINLIVCHGVWYKYPANICPPELSWRNEAIGPTLPDYSAWVARCQLLLQGGRHVADIAVLYPIAAIMADCYFGNERTTSDYLKIGDRLTKVNRHDFTFMHPEVLDKKCTVDSVRHILRLNNAVNREDYRVLIIPGKSVSGTISVSVLRKAKRFYDGGGVVMCTSKLPTKSAELGQDDLVRSLVTDIFGLDPNAKESPYKKNTNSHGGKAYFIPDISDTVDGTDRLTAALDDAVTVWDVRFDTAIPPGGKHGEVSYIHKVLESRDYYYFANSSDSLIDTKVHLRGKITPRVMDPHTGLTTDAQFQNTVESGQDVTVVTLRIDPVRSVFICGSDESHD
jgi:hypothetical protein